MYNIGVSNIDRHDAIDLAVTHINADAFEARGLYLYYDDPTDEHYIVSADDMAELGRMLSAGTRDAYSHWCNQSSATEVDCVAIVDSFPMDEDTDLDALMAEAGAADDMPTYMAIRFLRDSIEDIIQINAEIAAEVAA